MKQNRSTEGFSKLKRSVDMTSSGKNGLNIRTYASPKWDNYHGSIITERAYPQGAYVHVGKALRGVTTGNKNLLCMINHFP